MRRVVMIRPNPMQLVAGLQLQLFHKPFRQGLQVYFVRLRGQEDAEIFCVHVFPVFLNIRSIQFGPAAVNIRSFPDQILFKLHPVGLDTFGVLRLDHAFLAGIGFPASALTVSRVFCAARSQEPGKGLRRIPLILPPLESRVYPVFFVLK